MIHVAIPLEFLVEVMTGAPYGCEGTIFVRNVSHQTFQSDHHAETNTVSNPSLDLRLWVKTEEPYLPKVFHSSNLNSSDVFLRMKAYVFGGLRV